MSARTAGKIIPFWVLDASFSSCLWELFHRQTAALLLGGATIDTVMWGGGGIWLFSKWRYVMPRGGGHGKAQAAHLSHSDLASSPSPSTEQCGAAIKCRQFSQFPTTQYRSGPGLKQSPLTVAWPVPSGHRYHRTMELCLGPGTNTNTCFFSIDQGLFWVLFSQAVKGNVSQGHHASA